MAQGWHTSGEGAAMIMTSRSSLRSIAVLLLVALAPFALDGCVSIGVSRKAASQAAEAARAPDTGALEVLIYEKSADRDAGRLVHYPVFAELHRVEGGKDTVVGRSMAGGWSLPALPPGSYRLEVSKKIDDAGDIVPLEHPADKTFDVVAGQTSSATVVLEKVPTFWIILAVVTVVALVILGIDAARHGKLPMPPLPPLPPGMGFVSVGFSFPVGPHEAGEGPWAADVFPVKGSVVAARRVTVNFLVSMPLRENGIDEGAVLALGTRSGQIEGSVSYRPEEQLVRFVPSRNFTPGETVTVTLDLAKLTGVSGASGKGRFSTSFTVPVARE
jgi:hypothetical protein